MWCPGCRADVAAELSQDSRHFRCARCNSELGQAAGSFGVAIPIVAKSTDAEQSARDLLARWSAQNVLTPGGRPSEEKAETLVKSEGAAIREAQADRTPRQRRLDQAEVQTISAPELNVHQSAPRPANWSATIGQVCAYLGIGLITCGTAVVVWGYFGGPPKLAPTGWLVTTIGQMFLFLGVVTLISSGLDQTAAEVASRMETLGARLVRIESLQHELAGPHRRRKAKNQRRESRDNQQEAA
jgi:hypothetical protein